MTENASTPEIPADQPLIDEGFEIDDSEDVYDPELHNETGEAEGEDALELPVDGEQIEEGQDGEIDQ